MKQQVIALRLLDKVKINTPTWGMVICRVTDLTWSKAYGPKIFVSVQPVDFSNASFQLTFKPEEEIEVIEE